MEEVEFTERELNEIKLALFYVKCCGHGTAGHNRLELIAKMAKELGYYIYFEVDAQVDESENSAKLGNRFAAPV